MRNASSPVKMLFGLGLMACSVDDRDVYCADCDDAAEQGGTSTSNGGSSSSKGGSSNRGGATSGGVTGDGGDAPTSGGVTGKGGTAAGGKGGTAAGGTAGRGGAATTGGATGTGGATTPACKTNRAAGTQASIDDFEDGNLNISALEGRVGTWIHLRSDLNGMAEAPQLLTTTKLDVNTVVMGIEGLGLQPQGTLYPWAHVQSVLYNVGTPTAAKSCVYNAAAYDGLYFQATGTVNIRLTFEMDLNVPTTNTWGAPGACTAAVESDCYDRYGRDILVSSTEWREYYVLWSDLAVQGFGSWEPAFSPARLHAIYFEIVPDALGAIPDYAVAFDDVSFIPAGVTPPNPAP